MCSTGEKLNAAVPRRKIARPCGPRQLAVRRVLDDLDHRVGVGRLFERDPEIFIVKTLGDIGEGVEMFLELALRNQKQHHQMNGLIIECVEIHAFGRPAERAHYFVNQIRGSVRNADAETDAGAHGGLALLDHRGDLIAVFRLDLAALNQAIDQLIDRLPAGGSGQLGDDLIFLENVTQGHTAISGSAFGLIKSPFSSCK